MFFKKLRERFSKDRLREKLKMMLAIDRPPAVLALASALGVVIGISPYIGTQTYVALLVSGWFNLPAYPLIIGVYITNPITIPFIFGLTTKFGMVLLGMNDAINIDWSNVSWHMLLDAGKTLVLPFFVGTHAAGLILGMLTYVVVYYVAKVRDARRGKKW